MTLIEQILSELKPQASNLIPLWFPNGKYSGKKEYMILNPKRQDKCFGSFSINLERGFGYDFAEKNSYSLIDLYALAHGISVADAIRALRTRERLTPINGLQVMESLSNSRETVVSSKRANIAPRPLRESSIFHPSLGYPEKVYRYCDYHGNVIGYTCRLLVASEHGPSKIVLPLSYGANKSCRSWSWSEAGWNGVKPIYQREKLCSEPHLPVLITEGEKTCEAATRLFPQLCCITWRGGVGSVQRVDWSDLRFRRVFVWPDNDEPGVWAAREICCHLPQAKIVPPPKWKPRSWDLADAEEEGIYPEKLLKYIKASLNIEDASASADSPPLSTLP